MPTNLLTHYRTCNLCEAMCGLVIEHDGSKVLSIKGDKDDPFSRGHICPKAVALQDIHEDPNRLKQPMQRTADGFKPISWEQAFETITERIHTLQAEHGKDCVASYVGNPLAHNYGAMAMHYFFVMALQSKHRYSATSVDQLPHMLAGLTMLGSQFLLPVPDIHRCDYFICLGGNPLASNGSLMSCADVGAQLKRIARHGKLVVIDPRKTETAALANEHLFIRPGTDPWLLLAMVNEVFANGWVRLNHLTGHVEGIDVLKAACSGFSAELAERHCGIAAETIRRMTREFVGSERAILYARLGACTQKFGSLTVWLVNALNIITGHYDREGGAMFTHPAIDLAGLTALAGLSGSFDTYRSPVRNLPEFGAEFPVAELADNILSERHDRVRALFTVMGNPVLSWPNGNKTDRALDRLEFMVSLDFYITETSRHADIILPTTAQLEHAHFDLLFQAAAVRNTVKWSEPLFTPDPGNKHDWDVMLELVTRINSRDRASTIKAKAVDAFIRRVGVDGLMDLSLKAGPYGKPSSTLHTLLDRLPSAIPQSVRRISVLWTQLPAPLRRVIAATTPYQYPSPLRQPLDLNLLKANPHGIDLGPLRPCLPGRLFTPNQKIQLAPALMVSGLNEFRRFVVDHSPQTQAMQLIGRRHVRSNNSWLHNSLRLVKGKNRCTAILHPEDAMRLKIAEGDLVAVASAVGSVTIPAEISPDIMPGVISIPHGWGHDREGIQLEVAQAHAGVSINDVTDDALLEALTGLSVLNGGIVTVAPVHKTARKRSRARPDEKITTLTT